MAEMYEPGTPSIEREKHVDKPIDHIEQVRRPIPVHPYLCFGPRLPSWSGLAAEWLSMAVEALGAILSMSPASPGIHGFPARAVTPRSLHPGAKIEPEYSKSVRKSPVHDSISTRNQPSPKRKGE